MMDVYLPDECWECVFKFLINNDTDDNHRRYFHLRSPSLVSKQLLSITNTLRSSLTIYNPQCQFFHGLFRRFSNIASLNLSSYYGDLDHLLVQISRFPLNITSLNLSNQRKIPANGLRPFSQNITTLTSLICSNIYTLYSTDMFVIADYFPLLEELDLSDPKQYIDNRELNNGVKALSLALSKLRKINLSHHHYIYDESLFHLFENCKLLEEVNIFKCWRLSTDGIASALDMNPTLRSLTFCYYVSTHYFVPITSPFIDSLVTLKGLTCLDLFSLEISNQLLSSIAMERLPLTRLVLQNCSGYSYVGISALLSKCQCVQHLDLQMADFLNDQHVAELSLFLGNLVSINLSHCGMLTQSALFALVSNCPSLIEIKMKWTHIGRESVGNSNSLMDSIVNSQLKSLYLGHCEKLRNQTITVFATIFPNLQLLDLNSCESTSIRQVLSRFCNIRHLNLTYCSRVKLLVGMNIEHPKLEVLNLSHTTVNDETLYAISKGCRGLLQLDLECCCHVTEKGVKHVIENCTQLREINLRGCNEVHDDVSTMLLSSLSLRKIIAPPHFHFSRRKMKLFSCHGCIVD